MAKAKNQPKKSSTSKLTSPVSLRLEKGLLRDIDIIASVKGLPRSRIVSLVLSTYLQDRMESVERVIQQEADRAGTSDIFG